MIFHSLKSGFFLQFCKCKFANFPFANIWMNLKDIMLDEIG